MTRADTPTPNALVFELNFFMPGGRWIFLKSALKLAKPLYRNTARTERLKETELIFEGVILLPEEYLVLRVRDGCLLVISSLSGCTLALVRSHLHMRLAGRLAYQRHSPLSREAKLVLISLRMTTPLQKERLLCV